MPGTDRFNGWLAKAGITNVDGKGRRIEFHAMRHTFNTQLLKKGTPLANAQKLMRHTDPRLTANAYAGQFPLQEGVENLPALASLWGSSEADAPIQPVKAGVIRTDGKVLTNPETQEPPGSPAISADVPEVLIKAGEGGRTLDIHVGNVTLYH